MSVLTTVLIGVGNLFRQDDGAGLAVVQRLGNRKLADVVTIELSGEGAALMEVLSTCPRAYVFDAVRTGRAPAGTVYRIDAIAREVPQDFFSYSTHDFGVAEAIELARSLNRLPDSLIIYGIEGACFGYGTELSREVQEAVQRVEQRVAGEVKPEAVLD